MAWCITWLIKIFHNNLVGSEFWLEEVDGICLILAIGDIMAIKEDMAHYCTTLTYWMGAQLGWNWDRNLYCNSETM